MNPIAVLAVIAFLLLCLKPFISTAKDNEEDDDASTKKTDTARKTMSSKLSDGIVDIGQGWKEGLKQGREEYYKEHPEEREMQKLKKAEREAKRKSRSERFWNRTQKNK